MNSKNDLLPSPTHNNNGFTSRADHETNAFKVKHQAQADAFTTQTGTWSNSKQPVAASPSRNHFNSHRNTVGAQAGQMIMNMTSMQSPKLTKDKIYD